ncbi:PAS domain S-box [Deinococcus grandis]|uniref:histidine kinase n=2 Tax=Deinococcus TaxID=1298 RepID=A0A100HMJ4_9DEIO|nr:ATP-binding protein [Deinococcus grandis]BBN96558.1 hypothetical protein DEGR_32910 [Deinococcus grandis]GAQ23469.1 PAS domain S-box [Deinococcus grandis]
MGDDDLPTVPGGLDLLRLAFENLFGNAIKYTAGRVQARIELGVTTACPDPVVYMQEDGVGFDPRYVDRLFDEKAFQVIGMSLVNVQQIIERHGRTVYQEFPGRKKARRERRPKREGIELPRSHGPSCEVTMPRTPSLSRSVITALLNRATSISAVVPYGTVGKSTLCQSLAQETFASTADLKRRARNAPDGAFLAVDFVMVPHAGVEMEGVTYHYSGQAHTRLGHQFTSAALVKFGEDPVPLLERFKVSQRLETSQYPYRTATQEMIHTVNACRTAGVPIAGLLLDGEFGRDAAVTFSQETQIAVLIRAKASMTVQFEGESLTLDALGQKFPPQRCHPYDAFGWRVRRLRVSREVGDFDVLIVWRKVHGEWTRFFLFKTCCAVEVGAGRFKGVAA